MERGTDPRSQLEEICESSWRSLFPSIPTADADADGTENLGDGGNVKTKSFFFPEPVGWERIGRPQNVIMIRITMN